MRKVVFAVLCSFLFILVVVIDINQGYTHFRDSNDIRSATKRKGTTSSASSQKKPLIIYFSRSGTNYPNVHLKIGHTKQLAMFISDKTHGDQYEIVPAKPYPKNYQRTVDQAQREQQNNLRPSIKGKLHDVSKYRTIFIGYPIWWNEPPMIVRTFMDHENLNGKTIIPFSTNEGSGWGDSLQIIKRYYPQSHFLKGFSVTGSAVDNDHSRVNRRLAKLGY